MNTTHPDPVAAKKLREAIGRALEDSEIVESNETYAVIAARILTAITPHLPALTQLPVAGEARELLALARRSVAASAEYPLAEMSRELLKRIDAFLTATPPSAPTNGDAAPQRRGEAAEPERDQLRAEQLATTSASPQPPVVIQDDGGQARRMAGFDAVAEAIDRDTALTSLAAKHAAMFRSGEYARLEDAIAGAMTEALDSIDGAEMASALLRADKDRRGWMESYLAEAAELRNAKSVLKQAYKFALDRASIVSYANPRLSVEEEAQLGRDLARWGQNP